MPWKKFNPRKWSPAEIAAAVVGGIVLAVLFAAFFGFVVMYLWNKLMPDIFGLREITYWEAFGITILSRLLFGGFGGKGGGSQKEEKNKWFEENCGEEWEHAKEWWEKEGRQSLKNFSRKQEGAPARKDKKPAARAAKKG